MRRTDLRALALTFLQECAKVDFPPTSQINVESFWPTGPGARFSLEPDSRSGITRLRLRIRREARRDVAVVHHGAFDPVGLMATSPTGGFVIQKTPEQLWGAYCDVSNVIFYETVACADATMAAPVRGTLAGVRGWVISPAGWPASPWWHRKPRVYRRLSAARQARRYWQAVAQSDTLRRAASAGLMLKHATEHLIHQAEMAGFFGDAPWRNRVEKCLGDTSRLGYDDREE